jgi:aspartyl-tRNA(Asn)/glutamyl-tRNA(Gln) amidotransferase subunit A
VLKSAPELLDPDVAAIVAQALALPVADYYRAVAERYRFRERMRALFERCDLLVSPTLPVAGVPAGVAMPAGFAERNIVTWVCYTYPFNLTGQPAASIPAGFTAAGLPVGLQIVARAYREEDLFSAAAGFEAARPWAQAYPTDIRSPG